MMVTIHARRGSVPTDKKNATTSLRLPMASPRSLYEIQFHQIELVTDNDVISACVDRDEALVIAKLMFLPSEGRCLACKDTYISSLPYILPTCDGFKRVCNFCSGYHVGCRPCKSMDWEKEELLNANKVRRKSWS
ncbi:hypothetical protein Adt_02321 [Abeliophyllum distichum]|uniref:Uncharacterized protein n=1 Tax=Abeliophyllum distichum TaxID=126358 RepID=A0ABD1VXF1_9LAMI